MSDIHSMANYYCYFNVSGCQRCQSILFHCVNQLYPIDRAALCGDSKALLEENGRKLSLVSG